MLRFGNRIDAVQLKDQPAMLSPRELNPAALPDVPAKDHHGTFRREHAIVVEYRLDAYRTIQALRPGDATYPNESRFASIYRSITPGFPT
jgi:hypothetical protein